MVAGGGVGEMCCEDRGRSQELKKASNLQNLTKEKLWVLDTQKRNPSLLVP